MSVVPLLPALEALQPVLEPARLGIVARAGSEGGETMRLGPNGGSDREHVAALARRSRKPGPTKEVVCELVFRPLADLLVLALLPTRLPPPALVVVAGVTGVVAATELARGHLTAAALLVLVKTVLDNADGQLARATGRESALGRYLDSESDLIVNAALFAALGHVTGHWFLAAAGFVVLTGLLSLNFDLRRLYLAERGHVTQPMPPAEGIGAALARVYRLVYAPQDRLVEAFVEWRLRRLRAGSAARLAYHDRFTIAVLHNLGLSGQMAALAVCLALGRPGAYLVLVLGCGVVAVALELRRGHRALSTREQEVQVPRCDATLAPTSSVGMELRERAGRT